MKYLILAVLLAIPAVFVHATLSHVSTEIGKLAKDDKPE